MLLPAEAGAARRGGLFDETGLTRSESTLEGGRRLSGHLGS